MANILQCDRCHKQITTDAVEVREWTGVQLHKIGSVAPFQKEELCEECSNTLRNFLAKPEGKE
jgi:hypothetical protein